MSATSLVVAATTTAAVAVALAPGGWLARRAYRSARRTSLRRPPPGRLDVPGGAGAGPVAAVAPRPGAAASVAPVVLRRGLEEVGRRCRVVAGRAPDPAADVAVGAVAVVAVVATVVVSPWLAPVVVAAGWGWDRARARARRTAHERAVRTALPDAVDLFRLAAGSGLSVHQAVEAVAVRAPAPVADTLAEVRRRVAVGDRLGDALEELDRLGDPVVPLAAALRGAARYGTPLVPSLERVAADARVLRRRRAEEDARRLPVQLLFPLVMCVLPAFGLLAVVPLLLASLGSLSI